MAATGHGQSHAEEQHAIAAIFHALHEVFHGFQGDAGPLLDIGVHMAPLDQGAQRPQQFEIGAYLDLDENIGDRYALGAAHVNVNDGAVFLAVGGV